jgi:SOS-response transcriptional repressor LexA
MVVIDDTFTLKQHICARLKQLRIARGFPTAKAFALKHQLKVSTYTLHEAGTRSMSFAVIESYSQLLNVDKHWLLTGEGESRYIKTQAVPILDWEEIPLFPDRVDLTKHAYTPSELDLPAPSFAVKVQDDSMEPRYPQGTVLLVDKHQMPTDHEYALFLVDDKIVFQQYLNVEGKAYRRFLNRDMPLQKITQKVKILGKVVQAKIKC